MANELKATVINMKNLSQDITDPVVVGAGDAAGRALRIIFTQEAAAQFTPETKVYLSWWHQEKNIKGYNVFTEITDDEDEDFPPTWEIHYPKSMLYEGNVLACIQIVDSVSIATSVNFTIHVLIDPNDGSNFIASDDYTEFQKAIIQLASVQDQAHQQLINQKLEFEDMQLAFMDIRRITIDNQNIVTEAKQIAENALGVANEALETIEDFTILAREIQEKEQGFDSRITEAEEKASRALANTEQMGDNIADVAAAVREVAEKITTISCDCGIKEEEVLELIHQELTNYVTQDQVDNFVTEEQLGTYLTEDDLQGYATFGEVDEKLQIAIEEAQGEHQALWDAMQIVDWSDDSDDDNEEG